MGNVDPQKGTAWEILVFFPLNFKFLFSSVGHDLQFLSKLLYVSREQTYCLLPISPPNLASQHVLTYLEPTLLFIPPAPSWSVHSHAQKEC